MLLLLSIDRETEKAFSSLSSSSFLPAPERTIERSKKRAQLTFRKAQEHAKENRIKGYRASVKKGGPQGASLEFDIGTRQIHAYLEAFALLIKGGPGPRPRASKRRAAKKRGARGRRRRDYLPALSPPPPIWKRARKATKDRAHSCIDAWCPCTCASHSTKIRNEAPVLCKFMRVEVCASLARGRGETATTHIGYWVIGYTSVLLSSCTANPAREH